MIATIFTTGPAYLFFAFCLVVAISMHLSNRQVRCSRCGKCCACRIAGGTIDEPLCVVCVHEERVK